MTMKDNICEVCGVNPPIGVASTVMPYSCAYCAECCQRFAQPIIVFECFWDDFGADFYKMQHGLEELESYIDGRYISYREWAERRRDDRSVL
jgi:hypothetical protein